MQIPFVSAGKEQKVKGGEIIARILAADLHPELVNAALSEGDLSKRKVLVWSVSRGLCKSDGQAVDRKQRLADKQQKKLNELDAAIEAQEGDRAVALMRLYLDAEAPVEPLKTVDWRTLVAAMGGGDAKLNIALAFRQLAETAGKIAPIRARTMVAAAHIENALMTSWARDVTDKMKGGGGKVENVLELCMPKAVIDNLRALRAAQIADVESRSVEIFARAASRGPDDGESSLEDQIYGDLAEMTPEEQAEYSRTGRKPSRQQELPFSETETA